MAVRTTDARVRAIIDVDTTITDLTEFILAANELVTEVCAASSYSATRLGVIETWLAAHLVAIRDTRYASEGAEVSVTYRSMIGLHLDLTHYGQQVLILDTDGSFAALNLKAKKGKGTIAAHWLGTDLSEEADDE